MGGEAEDIACRNGSLITTPWPDARMVDESAEHKNDDKRVSGIGANMAGRDPVEAKSSAMKPAAQNMSGMVRLALVAGAAWSGLRRIVDAVAVMLLVAMIALIAFQILGRYVFNYSIAWSEEAAIFVQVWLVMLGAGIAMRNGNHVGVDVIIDRCARPVQRVAKAASFLLGAWLLMVIIVGSFSLISIGMVVKSAALQVPLAFSYAALPTGMAYFLVEFAVATWPDLRADKPDSPAVAEEGGDL